MCVCGESHSPLKDDTLKTLRCSPMEDLLKEPKRSLWKTVVTQVLAPSTIRYSVMTSN